MKISSCGVCIETWAPCEIPFTKISNSYVAVDRDQIRDIALFLNSSPSPGSKQIVGKISNLSDIDRSQIFSGVLALRFSTPPILVQISNSAWQKLQALAALLLKLTSSRTIGSVVRFRSVSLSPNFCKIDHGTLQCMDRENVPPATECSKCPLNGNHGVEIIECTAKLDLPPQPSVLSTMNAEEIELRDREQKKFQRFEDCIQRLQQENNYLTTQIKLEQSNRNELQQKLSQMRSHFLSIQVKLQEKETELQNRTEELIQTRASQELVMEDEIQRLRDVERVTNKARTKQNKMLSCLSFFFGSKTVQKSIQNHFAQWKGLAQFRPGRVSFKNLVDSHGLWHVQGKFLTRWNEHVIKNNRFRILLDGFLNKASARFLSRGFLEWNQAARREWKFHKQEQIAGLEARCLKLAQSERAFMVKLDSTLELMEAAESKHARKQEELRETNTRLRCDVQALESRLATASADRAALHQQAEGLACRLNVVQKRQEVAEKACRQLVQGLVDLERDCFRACEEQGMRDERTSEAEAMLASLEIRERRLCKLAEERGAETVEARKAATLAEGALAAAQREARAERANLEERLGDEAARRRAVEDALAKLVGAFRDQRLQCRRRLQAAAGHVRLAQAFAGWLRDCWAAAALRARATRRGGSDADEARRAEEREAELAACMEEAAALRSEAEAAAGREAALEAARERAEAELADLRARYLDGVQASVQALRLCRDRYLAGAPDERRSGSWAVGAWAPAGDSEV